MLALLSIILRYKKTVVIAAAAGLILSAAVSLIIPPRYVAMGAFVPGGVEWELSGKGSFLNRLSSFSQTYATFIRVQRNFVIDYMIRTRRMSDLLSDRFDLEKVYGVGGREEVRRKLRERTSIGVRDEGVIEISVEDRDPVRARDMAAAIIEIVDTLLVEMSLENTEAQRDFLEEELGRRMINVSRADSVMSAFMGEHGIYEVEQQSRAAFQVIAGLAARRSILEIEKKILEGSLNEGSMELERIDLELDKLGEQMEGLIESGAEGLFPPLSEMPELTSRYLGIVADRMMQEFAMAFVRLKLEDARISSGDRISVIRIIDPPVIPERRAWPKRKQIVIVTTMAVLFWTVFILLVREQIRAGRFFSSDETFMGAARPPRSEGDEITGASGGREL